jgi:hypothetical protein
MGYEEVFLDGESACKRRSYLWYAPKFVFPIGTHDASFEVRVGLLLSIRAARLLVDGQEVYAEGEWPRA